MACGSARDSVRRTCGPSAMPLFPNTGAGSLASGTRTVTMPEPSPVHSTPVNSVASSGVFESWVERPVAASATYRYDASLKLAMNASCVPDGDQVGDEIDAPLGVSIVRVAMVRGSMRLLSLIHISEP